MPDAPAKLSLAAGRLGGTIPNEMRDVISEIANNFGKGAASLSDLVTLRHILELVERLPVDVAPVEFDIMSSAAKEEVLLLLRGALTFVGQLH